MAPFLCTELFDEIVDGFHIEIDFIFALPRLEHVVDVGNSFYRIIEVECVSVEYPKAVHTTFPFHDDLVVLDGHADQILFELHCMLPS